MAGAYKVRVSCANCFFTHEMKAVRLHFLHCPESDDFALRWAYSFRCHRCHDQNRIPFDPSWWSQDVVRDLQLSGSRYTKWKLPTPHTGAKYAPITEEYIEQFLVALSKQEGITLDHNHQEG